MREILSEQELFRESSILTGSLKGRAELLKYETQELLICIYILYALYYVYYSYAKKIKLKEISPLSFQLKMTGSRE